MKQKNVKLSLRSEKGFTLVESLLVVGLTALIAAGVVMGFIEGLDTLNTVTDTQNVEFGHQRVMNLFMNDVQTAQWFYAGEMELEGGGSALRTTTNSFYLVLGYPGEGGDEVWVRYKVRYGSFSQESYLMRTVTSLSGNEDGTSSLTTGVSNLEFSYFDADGDITNDLTEVKRVAMTLSLTVGGATLQREYEATMRNPNLGVERPAGDFDSVETAHFKK